MSQSDEKLKKSIRKEGFFVDDTQLKEEINRISVEICYCVPTKQGNLYLEESTKSNIHTLKQLISRFRKILPHTHFKVQFISKAIIFDIYNEFYLPKQKQRKNQKNENISEAESSFIRLFERAVKSQANDIHISIQRNQVNAEIYFRVFGIIDRTPIRMNTNEVFAMIGSIFEWSGADQSDRQFSLDSNNATSFEITLFKDTPEQQQLEVRAEYRSMTFKSKVCILRLISSAKKNISQRPQNITDAQFSVFSRFMRQGQGLILVSGPTGSGKSTLLNQIIKLKLYSAILHTFENPIEAKHDDPLIFQGLISDDIGEDIARCMRYDLDIAVVGEMRLGKEFEAAMTLARTGHLILSTIHATDAISILTRLLNMGINATELSERNLLRLLTGQRLLPLICPQCSISLENKRETFDQLFSIVSDTARNILYSNKDNLRFKNNGGCNHCNHRGIVGRHLVLEQVIVDDIVRACIRDNTIYELKEKIKHNGWLSMADFAWPLITKGMIDPFDADNQIPEMFIEHTAWRY